jgi:GNAT superfamily N-acetyltransferase
VPARVQQPPAHPEHDAVAAEVRGWFRNSAPEIGYEVSADWFGYQSSLGPAQARVILNVAEPGQVPAALAAARAAAGDRSLTIWVDDRHRAGLLDAALRACGCRADDATTHLALVGPLSGRAGPDHLVLETVDASRLEEWAWIKIQCFDDTDGPPAPSRLAHEVASRRAETPLAECQLGRLGGEPVAIMAYYRGRDQMVFNLGTRLAYRHRGIAQAMLGRWVDSGTASGCRSLIINATEGGRPAALYRRLGFTDEVYWYRKYELPGLRS